MAEMRERTEEVTAMKGHWKNMGRRTLARRGAGSPVGRLVELRHEAEALVELKEGLEGAGDRFGELGEQVLHWIDKTLEPPLAELAKCVIQDGTHRQAAEVARQIEAWFRSSEMPLDSSQEELWQPVLWSLLMHLGDDRAADDLSEAVSLVSPGQATEDALWLISLIRKARGHLERGEYGEAIRQAWSATEDAEIDLSLLAEAYMLRAKAFRALGDREREFDESEAWHGIFAEIGFPGGAAEYFAEIQNSGGMVGATARRRMAEVLEMYSRLAYLREQAGEWQAAQALYDVLLRLGYHDWVDRSMPEAGTVRERAARGSVEHLPSLPANAGDRQLKVICPEERYRDRIEEEAAHRAVAEAVEPDPRFEKVVQFARVRLAENQFDLAEGQDSVATRLSEAIRDVAAENGGASLLLDVRAVKALNGRPDDPPHDLVVVTHGLGEPEIAGLGFAIRPVLVGTRLELGVSVLYMPEGDRRRLTRQQVVGLIVGGIERINGFSALSDQITKTVVRAGKRLGNSVERGVT